MLRRGSITLVALVVLVTVVQPVGAQIIPEPPTLCPISVPLLSFLDLGGLSVEAQLAINCLAAQGIALGTSPTTFSPYSSVTRWQMALFLTRTLTVLGVTLPSGASQGFSDIGLLDAATQTAINQLAQLGIAQGTSPTTFSPNAIVSRWQMALFLTRLLSAAGLVLPPPTPQGFTDIGALDVAVQNAINQLRQMGIAQGTTATTFSPNSDVVRWQMALFLYRVLPVRCVPPIEVPLILKPCLFL